MRDDLRRKISTNKKLGLVFFPAFDWMISPTHPERQERLLYTRNQLQEEGIFDLATILEYRPKIATWSDIARVHLGPNLQNLVTPAHMVSAGGTMTAADAVMSGEVTRAFALVRPPGHHAMRVAHGIRGFCVINIEAVMIEYLRKTYGVKKIAIVDTDVHHGDGTQEIFYNDPNVLFISFHQDGRTLYPGSGFPSELGSPYAYGSTINLPLLPGTGDQGIHRLYDNLIAPILEDFAPDIIINSAGQDNHYSDPLASMNFTAQGYARLADKLKANIAVLEGGYSVETALPYLNLGIILAMAEEDYSQVIEPDNIFKYVEPERCLKRVEELIKNTSEMWENRQRLRSAALHACHGKWRQEKNIYYDNDGISEEQIQTAYYCDKCSGFMTIETQAQGGRLSGRGNRAVYGVLELDACLQCQNKARDLVAKIKKEQNYKIAGLQNKALDELEEL